jgi:hypothetical protein
MSKLAGKLLWGAISAGLCCSAAAGADLSKVGQWTGQYPSDKIVNDMTLWEQPGVIEAMRAAMGKHFLVPSQRDMHAPEAPVTSDGKGLFVVWTCNNGDDCSGNNMTVFFDQAAGSAQVCWRSSEGAGGKVQDLWLANGDARSLPINGCGVGERDPFAPLKRYGAK